MRYELIEQYYNSEEYLRRLQGRIKIISDMEKDDLVRAKHMLETFSTSPVDFIETFGFIKIPEFSNKIAPFFLFPYQEKILWKLVLSENDKQEHEVLIDKPRGMGITWILVWYFIWRWLFTPNWSGFILSRTEAEVDDGSDNPDSSIFGKIRWGIKKLPPWIKPEGFKTKTTKGTVYDKQLSIINPAIGSVLIGSTTNANAGRSRRYSMTFIDECFSIERFNEVWRSLQSVSPVKLFVSTVKPGKVYRDFKEYVDAHGDYLSLSWKDHPFKDQQWFDDQMKKAEFDPEVVREISADYAINPKSQYYPEISQSTLEDGLLYQRSLPLYVSLDFGAQDRTVIIWFQYINGRIHVLEAYCNSKRPLDWYVPFMNPEVQENPDKYSPFQLDFLKKIRSWQKPVYYFGEAAHLQKVMPLNRSIAQELQNPAYKIRLTINPYAVGHLQRRTATTALLPRMVFNRSSDYVMELYDAISNSRYANSTRSVTSKDTTLKPVHDEEISDYRSAFENFCVNFPRILRRMVTMGGPLAVKNESQDPVIKALIKQLRV